MKTPDGVIVRTSVYGVEDTTNRLVFYLKEHGITLYARINQQEELKKNSLHSSPLEFILFGNPKIGGPLMVADPLIALDLPLKIIVWEDNAGKTQIAYNDFTYIARRYNLEPKLKDLLSLDLLVKYALES